MQRRNGPGADNHLASLCPCVQLASFRPASPPPGGTPSGPPGAGRAGARGPILGAPGAPSTQPPGHHPHAILVAQSVRRLRVRLLVLLRAEAARVGDETDGRKERRKDNATTKGRKDDARTHQRTEDARTQGRKDESRGTDT